MTPDYDYDDRTWGSISVTQTTPPVVAVWETMSGPGGTIDGPDQVRFRQRVTRYNETELRWENEVANTSTPSGYPTSFYNLGIERMDLGVPDLDLVFRHEVPSGWAAREHTDFGPTVEWKGSPIMPGQARTFVFHTPLVPIGYGHTNAHSPFGSSQGELGADGNGIAPGVPLQAALESVTFSGAKMFTIAADPGDAKFKEPPHWLDQNTNGLIDQDGDRTLPVGFVRKDQVKIAATFKVRAGTAVDGFTFVRADGPGAYDLPWTKATVADGVITLPETALAAVLADKVDYIADFKFDWQVTTLPIQQQIFTFAGRNTNEFFATLAAPAPPPVDPVTQPGVNHGIYITPLWLFCKEAKGSNGATPVPEVISKAFKAFAGKNVKTHASLDPMRVDPSVKMHYYKHWLVNIPTAYGLLGSKDVDGEKDGNCLSWVDLFRHVLVDGGVSQNQFAPLDVRAKTDDPYDLIFINKWKVNGPGTANTPPYTHVNHLAGGPFGSDLGDNDYIRWNPNTKKWEYFWGPNPEMEDLPGLEGQHTDNPRGSFRNHFMVRVGDTIYDPSYGNMISAPAAPGLTAWEAACRAWENHALAGHGKAFEVKVNNVVVSARFVFTANTPDTDLKFTVGNW